MGHSKSPFFWFILAVFLTGALTFFGPQDKALGENVYIVYLHGAWMLSTYVALAVAGLTGLLGLFSRHATLYRWSMALGRTGIFYWVMYLPLVLWVMQTNWNDLIANEPRFRIMVIFATAGVLLQTGLTLIAQPPVISLANALFGVTLYVALTRTPYVSYLPPSPIISLDNVTVDLFFLGLTFLTLAAAYFLTRWWLSMDHSN